MARKRWTGHVQGTSEGRIVVKIFKKWETQEMAKEKKIVGRHWKESLVKAFTKVCGYETHDRNPEFLYIQW